MGRQRHQDFARRQCQPVGNLCCHGMSRANKPRATHAKKAARGTTSCGSGLHEHANRCRKDGEYSRLFECHCSPASAHRGQPDGGGQPSPPPVDSLYGRHGLPADHQVSNLSIVDE